MSINTTPNLHLPQWTADEQPSFLAEINGAWSSIDTGYGQNKVDAATAISISNNAVSVAEAAKQQSQANAGQITQLLQQITNLTASIQNSAKLRAVEINLTVTDEWKNILDADTVSSYIRYNSYCANFELRFNMRANINTTIPENNTAINISGIPFIFQSIRCVGDIATTLVGDMYAGQELQTSINAAINSNGEMSIGLSNGKTIVTGNTPFAIGFNFCLPVFMANSSRNMEENCLYLPLDNPA